MFLVGLTQMVGVSLGVGASTVAIVQYILAFRDRAIDKSEKPLLHATYLLLRVAMSLILITLIVQTVSVLSNPQLSLFTIDFAAWLLVIALYANAILMTRHLMPRRIGPALQAATWYTLSLFYYFATNGLGQLAISFYLSTYATIFVVMFLVVNIALAVVNDTDKDER